MEMDGEGATNYEQLKDLIQKECDKRDRKYARLEDKYNKLEQQVTHKDHQNNMAQRGRQPNTEGTGALKKNISVQKQSQTRRNNSPKNKVSGNLDQPKRRNPENQGKAVDKNSDTWPSNDNKMPSASRTKSNRKPHRSIGKKKHHGVSQEETKSPIWIRCQPITFKPPLRL